MRIKQSESKRGKILYILTICLVFGITYFPILINHQMYMYLDIGADTYCSYWPSLSYVKNWLSQPTTWDMSLGLGAPTITQLCYFLIDPFNWIIILFRPSLMYIGIFISLMFKYIVLAVVSYLYVQKMNISNDNIICTIAASCIVFSGWFVGWGQHYNYATMYVFFIAILFMLEKWMQESRWLGFVIVLAYLCMMTPYYSYMILLFLALYYILRYFCINRKVVAKTFWLDGLKTAGLCLLAIGCSGIFFLPAVEEILNSPRVGGTYALGVNVASFKEFFSFVMRAFSNNILGINRNFAGYRNYYEAPFMYVGVLGLLLIPILFYKPNSKRIYYVIGAIGVFSVLFAPSTALIFNAFSSITYRWTFIYVPIMALGTGIALEKLKNNNDTGQKIITGNFLILFFLIIGYVNYVFKEEIPLNKEVFYAFLFIILTLVLYQISLTLNVKIRYKVIYVLFIAELSLNAFCSVNSRSLIPVKKIGNMSYFDESNDVVGYLDQNDSGFYRISKRYAYNDLNDSMIQHYSGEKYYCSTLSSSYWNIQNIFDLQGKNSNYFKGFNDKQFLRDIICSKYMISTTDNNIYGHDMIANFGNKYLYINENALEFGILYDCYISVNDFNNLPSYKKGDVLYQACVIEDIKEMEGLSEIQDTDLFEITEIGYSLNLLEDCIELTLKQPNESPILIEITSLEIQGQIKGTLCGITDANQIDVNDYMDIELGSNVTQYYLIDTLSVEKVLLNISPEDVSEVHLYEKNMAPIEKQIDDMKEKPFHILEFRDTYIHGKVNIERANELLFVPIIYDKNWHVYVNGVEQEAVIANGGFMAVVVSQGENDVVFRYEAKAYRYGMVLTACSILIIAAILGGRILYVKTYRSSDAGVSSER